MRAKKVVDPNCGGDHITAASLCESPMKPEVQEAFWEWLAGLGIGLLPLLAPVAGSALASLYFEMTLAAKAALRRKG